MSSTTEDLRRRFSGMLLGGRYRLDEPVGHGGMGAVFRASDERLERLVAVKVIQVDDEAEPVSSRQRFTREARLAARIQHPNVVTVHDYGTDVDPATGDELDYIVMELLRGESLAEWLPRLSRTDLALSADLLVQAARGVAAGHRAGIVHRDVKPRNLIVSPGEGAGRVVVRVVDFGIAKPRPGGTDFGEITVGQGFVGSARYASPEQLQGRTDPETESDVFSLGVVGYELLTGAHPFTDADRTRLSQGLHVPLRPPSVLNPAVPAPVEKVLLRCLHLDPAERYPDADGLVSALDEAWRAAAAAPRAAVPETTAVETGDRTEVAAARPDDGTVVVPPPVPERRLRSARRTTPRWRPGPRTWAASAAAAGVLALGGIMSLTMDGGVAGFFRGRGPRDLLAGEPLQGALGRRDSTLAPGVPFDVYRYRGPAGEPLTLALDADGFEGAIEWGRVLDGRWEPLESSDRSGPARIAVTVADTAEYRVRVQALRPGARGRYTLTVTPGPRSLSAEPAAGRLGPADTRLADGVWYEEWTFRGAPGEQVTVVASPDTFAARIEWGRVAGGQWERLEEAVSGDPGEDARLSVTTTDSGEYRVRVRNRREGQAGLYTLRAFTGPLEIQPGAEPSSRLSAADAGTAGGAPAETWVYRGEVGEPVTLSIRSNSVQAVVEWGRFTDGRWVPAAATSDTAPRLRVRRPSTDEYLVRVRGSRPGDVGSYTLSAQAAPRTAAEVRRDEPVRGTLGGSDPRDERRYYEEWSYSGTPGEEIYITLESEEVDPVLTFGCWTAAGVWQQLAWDDDIDYPVNRNAQVVARVGGSGECVIRVMSFHEPGNAGWTGTGSYTLGVNGL